MDNHHIFTLIEGEFSGKESRELLLSVFKSKINFHRMKNFSSHERFGKDDEYAVMKIAQLTETLHNLSQVIEEGDKEGKMFEIKSKIFLDLIDKDKIED